MWQRQQFERFLREHKGETDFESASVYLVNPQHIERLDSVLMSCLWPAASQAIYSSGLLWHGIRSVDDIPDAATDWALYASRTITSVLEDPKRPLCLPEGKPPWFLRCKLNCAIEQRTPYGKCEVPVPSYMITMELFVECPIGTQIVDVSQILRAPSIRQSHPSVSIEESIAGEEYPWLAFQWGGGKGYPFVPEEESVERIRRCMSATVDALHEADNWQANRDTYIINDLVNALARAIDSLYSG